MVSLSERLLKNSTIKETSTLKNSKVFEQKKLLTTPYPCLNIALTGDALEGGMPPGILQIAAKSKHFKSKFAIELTNTFISKFPQGAVLFYDSEFGTPESYFNKLNVENIVHTPVVDLDQLNSDIVNQIDSVEKGDKLLILIDSLGNLASIKEITDAKEGKGTVDLTRSKKMKSLFRMIGPRVALKDIYVIAINHTYDTLDLYSKEIVSGGSGGIYGANIIWIISKSQNKDADKELLGYNFTIRIEKSRFVREGSKVPITVDFDGGIQKWSGMFDLALEAGYLTKVTAQKFSRSDKLGVDFKRKEIENDDVFWTTLFKETNINEWIKKEYQLND